MGSYSFQHDDPKIYDDFMKGSYLRAFMAAWLAYTPVRERLDLTPAEKRRQVNTPWDWHEIE